ncbi:MAG: hypothetical protein M1834_002245 [Cirrosporium novae-zelandiae]|nr:MAG: hypothetical protein M1834_002245 [Cirrosporium novae-zelandiae]
MTMQFSSFSRLALGLLAAFAAPTAAFWRLPCKSPLVVERADPIVTPGKISSHVHTIMGGNGFGFTMNYAQTQASTCSSCTVSKDMSNYWTPNLYYHAENGSFIDVEQVGGVTVYYLQRSSTGSQLAFPKGFRMVSGNPFLRNFTDTTEANAVSYACLNYDGPATAETNGFPTVNCPDGLRSQVYFPSCWDGVNLDSTDHKSHVAFPTDGYNGGICPDTHPKHLVSIFFEIIWNTNAFTNDWYGDSQPFVWAMGDPTGYGFHGDFVNGWDIDTLQNAVDTCTNDSGRVEDCPVFDLISDTQAEGCKIGSSIDETVTGVLDALPGCNTVQDGPEQATVETACASSANVTIGNQATFYTDVTQTKDFEYVGCGTDGYGTRILTGANESNENMTVENCIDFCVGQGYSVAGMEYADQCYCGDSIPSSGAPTPGIVGQCTYKCAGDSTEYCGGYGTISLYQKCGSTCENAQFGVSSNSTTSESSSLSGTSLAAASTSVSVASTLGTSTTMTSSVSVSIVASTAIHIAVTSSTKSSTPSLTATTAASPSEASAKASSTISSISSFPTKVTNITLPSNWHYAGCYTDAVNPRSLPNWGWWGEAITSSGCASYCNEKGYSIAGTEYSGQCFCGNALAQSEALDEGECNMTCEGDAGEICGGSAKLSVFTKLDGSARRHKRHGRRDRHAGVF